jgi:NADH dehydrogenase [ubiquinone] 1 alpha subcomplex assembly factor 7
LLIDYGYDQDVTGETLQAMKEHGFVSVLSDVGEADLTALVDFKMMAKASQVPVAGPVTQGAFLRNMGIQQRFDRLKAHATPAQVMELQNGMVRLIAEDQMGTLFKVMGLCHDKDIALAGFSGGGFGG